MLHRLKPPLEGRWRAQRDGEVLGQLRFPQGFPTTLAGTDAQCAPLRVRCTIEPRCRGRCPHRPVPRQRHMPPLREILARGCRGALYMRPGRHLRNCRARADISSAPTGALRLFDGL